MERLMIAQLLPVKGSFLNLKLLRKAREDLSFDEEEHKRFNLKQTNDGRVEWVDPGNSDKNIDFGVIVSNMIVKALQALDEKEELEEKYFSLFEKFVK